MHTLLNLLLAHRLWVIGFCTVLFAMLGYLQKLNLPMRAILPVIVITLGYKVDGKWRLGDVRFGHAGDQSLFFNGILCIRFMLPFFVGFGFRWAGTNPSAREFLHTCLGWKLNGELALEFRIQSDESSTAGATAPNAGQAYGWNQGTK